MSGPASSRAAMVAAAVAAGVAGAAGVAEDVDVEAVGGGAAVMATNSRPSKVRNESCRRRRGQVLHTNLITGGRPRAVPFVRRHAARVAASSRFAAKREEIWIRRRERRLIDSDLTGVGISGRAAPLAAQSAAVGVDNKTATPVHRRLEAGARARRGALRGRGLRRQEVALTLVC